MKTYTINNHHYVLPGATTLRQYKQIHRLLKDAGVPFISEAPSANEFSIIIKIGMLVSALLENDIAERFFALILAREGECWSEEASKENLYDMVMLDEIMMEEILRDFFTGKVNLLRGALTYFASLSVKNDSSIPTPADE